MSTPQATPKEKECVKYLKKKCPSSLLDPEDKDWLSDSTYLRFARARDGNNEKAAGMLNTAIEWRKSYKPYQLTADDVAAAMKQFTMVCGGRCKKGFPVIVMSIGAENATGVEERTKQLIYIMEETQRKGYLSITWIVDFNDMGKRKDIHSKKTRKETMQIMQDYYPERLGQVLLYRPPWYIRMLVGVAKSFMDARTAAKIYKAGSTIEELEEFVDRNQVPQSCGGTMKGENMERFSELPCLTATPATGMSDGSPLLQPTAAQSSKHAVENTDSSDYATVVVKSEPLEGKANAEEEGAAPIHGQGNSAEMAGKG